MGKYISCYGSYTDVLFFNILAGLILSLV